MATPPFLRDDIQAYFEKQPAQVKPAMLRLRSLIYAVAGDSDLVDGLEETLKWGEPSYINKRARTGTTLRLAPTSGPQQELGLFVHCQTTLVANFKEIYPDLDYQGNRCLRLNINNMPEAKILEHFIFLALTYHHQKRQQSAY